ncbi:S41 family peptidase [Zavarzinella formosa]|uniref:S41 family peptidase n=1 Tax=Zavarzinella formosa TaxID=360055 RepID=UPI0003096E88|nr:S41 family peptidase [Zavarzinella formosa]
MNRLRRLGIWAVATLLGFSSAAMAQDNPAKTRTHAVVVGVGSFADKDIKPRATADSDAVNIAKLLTDKSVGGVDPANLTLLLSAVDDKNNAKVGTKEAILKAIGDASAKAGKDDTLVVYLVMQGATSGEKPCLFATDSTFKDRTKNAIFASEIEEKVKGLKSEQFCVFLDFNLKAFESKESILAPNINEFVRAFMGIKEKDSEQEPPIGREVFMSGNGILPPITVNNQGSFTKAIVDALRGKADTEGYEADGLVTVDEVQKYVEKALPDLIRDVAKTSEEKLQRVIYFGRSAHFPLSHNPEAFTKTEERLKKFDGQKTTAKLDKEIAQEGDKLLSRMPRLKAMQELRKAYQKFADGDLNTDQLKLARDKILAGMKLSEDDAKAFAEKTYEGLSFVKANYIKKLNLGEMVANGVRGIYRVTETTLPDDLKKKLEKAKDLSDSEAKDLLLAARIPLGKREDLESNKDIEITMNMAMRKFVDDYTSYFDKEKVEDLNKDIDGKFTGIGVQIRRDISRDGLVVVTPIRNSPAYKAGVLTGDLITEIIRETDGKGVKLDPVQVTTTKGMETTDAVKLILGLPGTKVKLKIDREGSKDPLILEITRGLVEVESVYGYKRNEKDDSWDFYIDPKNKIAYIHLTQFARNSAIDMLKAVKQLQKDGVRGVILDLRFNPGGFLDVAVSICDMFIDDGVIVSVRPENKQEKERTIKGRHEGSYLDFPMVCLVNEGSASGSEILSACLQDHNRAVVMGERSYGKGSVQNVEPFAPTGGKIKLTTATFWPPSARNLNKASTSGKEEEDWGVRPDKGFELKLERAEKDELFDRIYNWGGIPRRDISPKEKPKEFKDRQLEMALDYLRNQIKVARSDSKGGKD